MERGLAKSVFCIFFGHVLLSCASWLWLRALSDLPPYFGPFGYDGIIFVLDKKVFRSYMHVLLLCASWF